MLALRLKRTGRTGHAQFRLVAQDKRFSPASGRVSAYLGHYDPHTKKVELDVDKISEYLKNGAQPSPRVVKLLKKEGVKLPAWVAQPADKKKAIRNPEKLRRNRPAETEAKPSEKAAEAPAEIAESAADQPTETPTEQPVAEGTEAKTDQPAEEPAEAAAETKAEPEAEVKTEPAVEDQPKAEA